MFHLSQAFVVASRDDAERLRTDEQPLLRALQTISDRSAFAAVARRVGLMPVLFNLVSSLDENDQAGLNKPMLQLLYKILNNVCQKLKDPAYEMLLSDTLPILAELLMRPGSPLSLAAAAARTVVY